LFSAEIMKDSILFFKKKRIIMITDKHVCITDKNKKYFKKKDQIDRDLLAVTQSLYIGYNNIVIHFKTRPDRELQCDR
jgi:hypothetical protein